MHAWCNPSWKHLHFGSGCLLVIAGLYRGLKSKVSTLRLLGGSWALLGRVSALGVRVRDLTTRVQEP